MDSISVKKACEKHKTIVDEYYKNDGREIRSMIDTVLFNLKFNVDKSDFYSIGNEIFLDALCRYDDSQSFESFLYSCLMNKFKTEMTRRNRVKRKANAMAISIDTPIGDKEKLTVGDILADKNTVEKHFFDENKDCFSRAMNQYLNKLSPIQQEVLRLISIGFSSNDIIEELHINKKQYEDCYNAIHAYRNISILM